MERRGNCNLITEGSLKQAWTRKRKAEKEVAGTGERESPEMEQKNYTRCQTGKGRLGW